MKPKSKPSHAATLSRGLNLQERIALREIEKILLSLPPESRMNLIEDLNQRRNAQKAAASSSAKIPGKPTPERMRFEGAGIRSMRTP